MTMQIACAPAGGFPIYRPPHQNARFLKRPASWRGTGLRVARTDEEFVDCDHRGASDDGNGRHHENSFDHGSLLTDLNAKTPEESCSRKTRELRGRAAVRRSAKRLVRRSSTSEGRSVPTISKRDGDRWWARR
jgi:hypothetical protein